MSELNETTTPVKKQFKILVISYYFPPKSGSGVQRVFKFVKYMPQTGWLPTVLTADDVPYFAFDDALLEELDQTQVKVVPVKGNELLAKLGRNRKNLKMPREWIRKLYVYLWSWFYIPDNKTGWAKVAYEKALELTKNEQFDLIYVSGPPFSAVEMAVKLKKETGLPLAIDYRDLWYGFQFAMYPTPFHRIAVRRREYEALKTAEKIFVTNRRIKEFLMETYKFVNHSDIVIVPHGFDHEDFKKAGKETKPHNKMILAYSGIFMDFVTPVYFLKAFREIVRERPEVASNIELQFIGLLRDENVNLIKKLELQPYVKDFGYLSHLESVRKIATADVLWFMVGKGRNTSTVSSGKLFEYIGAEKPIIGCVEQGALRTALQEYPASFITEPDNIEQIKQTIIKVYELYKKGELPQPDRESIDKYRRDTLTAVLTKELQFMVKLYQPDRV